MGKARRVLSRRQETLERKVAAQRARRLGRMVRRAKKAARWPKLVRLA